MGLELIIRGIIKKAANIKIINRHPWAVAASVPLPFVLAAGCSDPPTTAPFVDVKRIIVGSSPGHWGSHHAPDHVTCRRDESEPSPFPDYSQVNAFGHNFDITFVDSNETWLRVPGAPFTLEDQHNDSLLGANPIEGGYWTTGNCVNSKTFHAAASRDGYGRSCSIFTMGMVNWPIRGIQSYGSKWDFVSEEYGDLLPSTIDIQNKIFTVVCDASDEPVGVEFDYHFQKDRLETHYWNQLTGLGWVFGCATQYSGPLTTSSTGISITDSREIKFKKEVDYASLEAARLDDAVLDSENNSSSVGSLADIVNSTPITTSTPVYKMYSRNTPLDIDANDFQTQINYEESFAYRVDDISDIFRDRGIRWGVIIETPEDLRGEDILSEKFTKYGQSTMIKVVDANGVEKAYKTRMYPFEDRGDSFLAVSEEILFVWNQDISGHYTNSNPEPGFESNFYAVKLVVPAKLGGWTTGPMLIPDENIGLREIGQFTNGAYLGPFYNIRWDKNFDGEINLKDLAILAGRYAANHNWLTSDARKDTKVPVGARHQIADYLAGRFK
jgi:hypothetical protein